MPGGAAAAGPAAAPATAPRAGSGGGSAVIAGAGSGRLPPGKAVHAARAGRAGAAAAAGAGTGRASAVAGQRRTHTLPSLAAKPLSGPGMGMAASGVAGVNVIRSESVRGI